MIVDTMGMLAAIYRYGQLAYIGGGFGSGIHNVLEAATYGIPVIYGPKYKKYKEAGDLVELGGGFEINSFEEFGSVIVKMWDDVDFLKSSGMSAEKYVNRMCGATSLIMKELF
jgi:3-deoxy-D-manno-octulosonic-acid transferase